MEGIGEGDIRHHTQFIVSLFWFDGFLKEVCDIWWEDEGGGWKKTLLGFLTFGGDYSCERSYWKKKFLGFENCCCYSVDATVVQEWRFRISKRRRRRKEVITASASFGCCWCFNTWCRLQGRRKGCWCRRMRGCGIWGFVYVMRLSWRCFAADWGSLVLSASVICSIDYCYCLKGRLLHEILLDSQKCRDGNIFFYIC